MAPLPFPRRREVTLGLVRQMLAYCASRGIRREAVLARAGLPDEAIGDPDARIPVELYLRVQCAAEELAEDEFFGLHMGEFAEFGSYSIVGYLMSACATLAEAYALSGRYARLVGNVLEFKPRLRPGRVRIELRAFPGVEGMTRHCFESACAGMAVMNHALTGIALSPLLFESAFPEPSDRAEYERVFRCRLGFGARTTAIEYDLSVGALPIAQGNSALRDHFEAYAREALRAAGDAARTSDEAAFAIARRLPRGDASLPKVARELGRSARSLQEDLAAEGTTFRRLLDESRERLARGYLAQGRSVDETAVLLGFSEAAAFRRAFQRWTGTTPRDYRAGLAGQA